jgi:hypothetical protein
VDLRLSEGIQQAIFIDSSDIQTFLTPFQREFDADVVDCRGDLAVR